MFRTVWLLLATTLSSTTSVLHSLGSIGGAMNVHTYTLHMSLHIHNNNFNTTAGNGVEEENHAHHVVNEVLMRNADIV